MGRLQKLINDLKTWCLANGSWGKQIMSEWTGEVDGKKNVDISDVTKASGKKAKWKCANGHEWYAVIADRTSKKTGCPYCHEENRGEIVTKARLSEENSLKTWCLANGSWGKQIMSEWTGEVEDKKNVNMEDVTKASNKRAKWKCPKGHEWIATIASRTSNRTSCQICAKAYKEKSLKIWCLANGEFGRQLMSEWTGEFDGSQGISIDEVSFGSHKQAKWKCSKGHEWIATITNRTSQKTGCPYCFKENRGAPTDTEKRLKNWCLSNGSFGKQLMSEWTGEVGNKTGVSIDDVAFGSTLKAKWKCSNGHEWIETIHKRTSCKTVCNCCNYDTKKFNISLYSWCLQNGERGKQIIEEWTENVYGSMHAVSLNDIRYDSVRMAEWACVRGHVWEAPIIDRTIHEKDCPYCKKYRVLPENLIYFALKQIYPDIIKNGKTNENLTFSMIIPSLQICIDYFGDGSYLDINEEVRKGKEQACKSCGIRYIQIVETDKNRLYREKTPNYICFKYEQSNIEVILRDILDYILQTLGHSISEVSIKQAMAEAKNYQRSIK